MTDTVIIQETANSIVVQEVSVVTIDVVSPGPQGPAATVAVGTINTVAPNVPAAARNTGTSTNAVLDFDIPKGETGDVTPAATAAKVAAETAATAAAASQSVATTKASEAAGSAATATTKAGEASASATSAANSAASIFGSVASATAAATTATTKASEASASAATASTKASEASTSAGNAATSATNAASSASTASGAASTATTKASEAAASAASMASSVATATTKAAEASTSAASAATSATSAGASATTATTQAAAASSSATSAQTSAGTATAQAGVASTKAAEAATSASNASDSASTASTQAGLASTSATNAAASATTATTKASEALTSATNAAGSATTANSAASSASTSATSATGSATAAGNSASAAATSATSASGSASTATTQAGVATTQAGIATTKASEASASASDATSSASTASTKATEASVSATVAAAAKAAAEAARDQTLAAFDSFDDRYLGQKSSDPSVDNDGNALVAGALYYNINPLNAGGGMKVYDATGSAWLAAYASLSGALINANNLSDLASASAARINLGLGNVEDKSSATIRGELTSSNVVNALGFAPYNAASLSSALAPYLTAASAASTYQTALVSGTSIKTVNGQSVLGSGNIQIDGGVTSFNTRTGAVTLSLSDVTTALGFTPYNATNPSGFLASATAASTYAPLASPSFSGTITLSGNTANSIPYLNSSKQLVSSSGLTFNGTNLLVAGSATLGGAVIFNNYSNDVNNNGIWISSSTSALTISSYSTALMRFRANNTEQMTLGTSGLNVINAITQNGNQVLHAGNFTSYAPGLTGSGASGTWSIGISGNAATVTSVTSGQVTTALGFTPANAASLATVATTGAYADLTGKPTALSAFTNDAGFLTSSTAASTYQPALVSGTNIKSINGSSLLGSGNLSVSGGVTYTVKTSAYTLVSKDGVIADTTAGAFTLTLPASPATGDQVVIADGGTWGTNNLTVARNGSTIEGLAENLILDVSGVSVQLIYSGSTWQVYTQAGVATGSLGISNVTGLQAALDAKASDSATTAALASKQGTLVSGTNIKTLSGQSILGSGDLAISTSYATVFKFQ